jgi:hypothetical protein
MIEAMIAGALGALTLLTPLLVSVGGVVAVRGSSDCPSPAAVTALLPDMPSPAANAGDDVAVIDSAGPDLAISILGPDGSVHLTRRLARPEPSPTACAALAQAVAVVIATWEDQQSAGLSLLQPDVYPPAPAPPTVFRAAPPPLPAGSEPGGAALFLQVALGASVSQSATLATGQIQLGLRGRTSRLGLWLALAVDGQGELSQAGGTSRWRRIALGLGPWVALSRGAVGSEVGVQLFLGRTSVEGSGFPTDRSDAAISPGFEALARLVGPGSVQPFLEGGVRGWFAPQEIDIVGAEQADSHASLPRLEARLMAGVRVRLGT